MPKTKSKKGKRITVSKKGKQVVRGKGSGNIDIRVNVQQGKAKRKDEEELKARRLARSLGLIPSRGFPYNYPNRRIGGGGAGGGGGLSGSVQEIKTPNRTEVFGATGFTPLVYGPAIPPQPKEKKTRTKKAAEEPSAPSYSMYRPSPMPDLPPPMFGRPSPGRSRLFGGAAGRVAAPPAAPQGRSEEAEERAQDAQEAASVASYGTSIGLPPPARASGIFQASASPIAFAGSAASGIGEGGAPASFASGSSGTSSSSTEEESMITPSGEISESALDRERIIADYQALRHRELPSVSESSSYE